MTALHELYLEVKAKVAAAVAAVNSATEAAAQIAHQAIQEALAAVEALDDYLDYFGWVGDPIDAAVEAFLEQLYNLAKELDARGYDAIYMKTFGAANQYANAKKAYDEFTGGHGGRSSGGGASGWFGTEPKNYPLYTCHNRNGAKLNVMGKCVAPTEAQVDFTVILGACSEVFIYENNDETCDWDNGVYQFVRWRVLLYFWDKDVYFPLDYGETPKHSIGYWPSNYKVVTDRSTSHQFADAIINSADWGGAGNINYWPSDTSWQIVTNGETKHDRKIQIIGRYEYNGHNYWLYNESYWFASHQAAYRDPNNQPISNGNPDQVMFVKVCEPSPTPGKNKKPWAPWAIFLSVGDNDDEKKKKLMKTLRLGLDLRPYDVCCNRQKILCDGQQVTCGDPEGA